MQDDEQFEQIVARREALWKKYLDEFPDRKSVEFIQIGYSLEEDSPTEVSYLSMTNGADSPMPNLRDPENENLGLRVLMGQAPSWPDDLINADVHIGFALGFAQMFTRLENWNLATVFLRLANVEERAMKIPQARAWKKGESFPPEERRQCSDRIFSDIMRCCVLADKDPDRFALTLSDVYEAARVQEVKGMSDSRTGKRRIQDAERIIEWMRTCEKPNLHSATIRLIELRMIKFEKGDERFWILDPKGGRSKGKWKRSTLKTWWQDARREKSEEV